MIAALIILASLLVPAVAWAAGPVNPSVVVVTLPQTNADGTTLTDLADVRFCVGPAGAPALANCQTVPVTTPDPPASALASVPLATFALAADGQYEADVDAGDTAGNRSAKTARAPFEWNRQAPGAPGLPTFR